MRVKDKVVVITGASSGVGREAALLLAQEGANVVAVARREERLVALAKEAEEKGYAGKIVPFAGDISLEETNVKMIDKAIEVFGRFDVLVNNAGLMDNFAPVEELDGAALDRLMKVDVYGPAFATKKAVQEFLKAGSKGSIVMVSSIAGIGGGKSGTAYTMAKHALMGLVKNVAVNYRLNDIRCNAICPGGIQTEMVTPEAFKNASQKGLKNLELSYAFNPPMATPRNIADIILFLASDESAVVNGATITADSGMTAY